MLIATDPLSLVFIACFLFGLLFFLVTALLGNIGHGHVGAHGAAHHMGIHVGGHAHAPVAGAAHTGVGTHVAGTPAHGQAGSALQSANNGAQGNFLSLLSIVNPTSVVLFLLGFGFFGYVFHNTTHLELPFTLTLAGIGGILIAAVLLVLLSRLFQDSETDVVNDVSDRTGLLGKVSITIPEDERGLGEIIYTSPGGMRKSIPARSTDGRRLERGQEVVVVNYQHGVAEVDTWERFINEEDVTADAAPATNEEELAQLRALLEESPTSNTEFVMRKDVQKE